MSNFVSLPIDKLMNAGHVANAIDNLETKTAEGATVTADTLDEISSDLGVQVSGKFIAPIGENIVPNDAGFSGAFVSGSGEDFDEGNMKFGAVTNGALNFGVADDGSVIANSVTFNGSEIDARVVLNGFGYMTRQTGTEGSEVRIMRIGMQSDGTYPEGRIEFIEPGAEITIPNGDFASLDMSDWTETQIGVFSEALGTLSTSFQVRALAVIGTDLYAGVTNGTTSSVWKWNGSSWAALGTLSTSFEVYALAVIGTDLYAGLANATTSSVWKWNGSSWAALGTLSTSFNILSLAVIGTDLYAGVYSGATTSSVWKWNGSSWAALGTLSTSFGVYALAVIGTDLYAGMYSGATTSSVWKWNGSSWAALGTLSTSFNILSLTVIGTDLYAGMTNGTTSSVWKWNGSSWAALGTLSTSFQVRALAVIGTDLYAGMYSGATTSSVWKWNGSSWAALGTLSTSFNILSLAVIETDLYAGMYSGATTSSVWKLSPMDWDASAGYASIDSGANTTVSFQSAARYAVTAGQSYDFGARSGGVATGGTLTATIEVEFYDALTGGSLISTEQVIQRSGESLSWTSLARVIVTPAGATHAVFVARATADVAYQVWFDSFEAQAATLNAVIFGDNELSFVMNDGTTANLLAGSVPGTLKTVGLAKNRDTTGSYTYAEQNIILRKTIVLNAVTWYTRNTGTYTLELRDWEGNVLKSVVVVVSVGAQVTSFDCGDMLVMPGRYKIRLTKSIAATWSDYDSTANQLFTEFDIIDGIRYDGTTVSVRAPIKLVFYPME